jgi:predicted RNA binding protein YcfA (HicA-like mRNA interferase family)
LKKGFSFKSQEGSHAQYTKGSLTAIAPIHNKPIKRGTLKNILSQAKISLDDLLSALNKPL